MRIAGTLIHAACDDDRRETFLVSDLHVPQQGGTVLARLQVLLAEVARRGAHARLVVLGDLFEALVNERQLRAGRWPELLRSLRAVADAGVSVTVLHGNRDFMLGRHFARATAARVLAGGLDLHLDGQRAVLLHGDELCTNDLPYQRSKRWMRSWMARTLCRLLPRRGADWVASVARRKSGESTRQGDPARFAPVVDAVGEAFAAGYRHLVFGHVHTPGRGTVGEGEYLVLPAFDEDPVYVTHVRGEAMRFRALGEAADRTYGPLEFAAPW